MQHARGLIAAGKPREAEAVLKTHLVTRPKDPLALLELARLYNRKLHRPREALLVVERLLKVAPGSHASHQEAAETFCNLRAMDQALVHAERAMALAPQNPDVLYVAATVYDTLLRFDDAIACLNRALKIRPGHIESRLLLASSLRSAGRLDECIALCHEIFADQPDNFYLHSIYNRARKFTADDPLYLRLRDHLVPGARQAKSHYLAPLLKYLAKAEDDIGDHDAAFRHFAEGKAEAGLVHDSTAAPRFTTAMMTLGRADFFGRSGDPSESPVLIVGLPRCGSTLLEQILASHPDAAGIGEAGFIRKLRDWIGPGTEDPAAFARAIREVTPEKAADLGGQYVASAAEIAAQPGALRIVDKNLHNFEMLGMVARLLPNARVLHATRDPMDHCLSMYMQPLSEWHTYTTDLTSLGRYYVQYRRLMAHWKTVLPLKMMEVPYESVVADTEGMARQVIDFLGLEWNDACLDFQKSEKRVKTLSVAQVRQPIYSSSVQRWRRYEAHLDPLKEELKSFYPDGF